MLAFYVRKGISLKTGIIFDVDGTLWDSSPEVAASWAEVFRRHPEIGRECTPDEVMGVMGKAMTEIAAIFFPKFSEAQQRVYLKECEDYELVYLRAHPPKAFAGVREVFEALAKDYPLFIVSNCQSGYVELFMELCGVARFVTDIECFGNNQKPKAENIRLIAERNQLERYFYVGDIQSDYDATVAGGGEFIFAAYGFGEIAADVPRIEEIGELPGLLGQLLSGI